MEGSTEVVGLRWRVASIAALSIVLFAVIAGAFWHEDLRFSRPTPRPAGLRQPPLGALLPVRSWLDASHLDAGGRPVHLHFMNPTCPCTRFNLTHMRELIRGFGDRVYFVAVLESDLTETASGRRELEGVVGEIGLRIPWIADVGGRIAAAAGVYSTPQAVILDRRGAMYYRGNYNTTRYCVDRRTQFARIALENLTRKDPIHAVIPDSPAYGCALPSNTNRE